GRQDNERRVRQSGVSQRRVRAGNLTSTTAAAFNTPASTFSCTANVKRTQELSIGFWQQLYKGDLGQVRVGAQYEFVRLTAFPGSPIAAPPMALHLTWA